MIDLDVLKQKMATVVSNYEDLCNKEKQLSSERDFQLRRNLRSEITALIKKGIRDSQELIDHTLGDNDIFEFELDDHNAEAEQDIQNIYKESNSYNKKFNQKHSLHYFGLNGSSASTNTPARPRSRTIKPTATNTASRVESVPHAVSAPVAISCADAKFDPEDCNFSETLRP